MIYTIALLVFATGCVVSALMVLLSKNVFKAVLSLLVCLLCIAGLYVLMFAEFVAVTQILMYAGGVSMLMIFGIMLTSRLSGKPLISESNNLFGGVIVAILICGMIVYFTRIYFAVGDPIQAPTSSQPIENIGINLMTSYSLPFELAGIILLVSLVGAAVVTSFMKAKKNA